MAATGTGVRSRPRAVLPALCLTQITSWGIVYDAFPVLNPAITADTGWNTGATTAAFSAALVPFVGAVLAGPLGGYPALFALPAGLLTTAAVPAFGARAPQH